MLRKRVGKARVLLILLVGALSVLACDDSTGPGDRIVEGVDLDELFAEPTIAEAQAILDAWGERDVTAKTVETVLTRAETMGTTAATLRIVSHVVDEAEHFGAILVPDGAAAASLPVLIYTHGGDGGVDVDELLPLIPFLLGGLESDFVFVAPSFRAEPLIYDGATYLSEGAPSPWDRDVDDALALLSVALSGLVPEADPSRVGVIGFSRGANVALLMAERDTRIDLVVEFFGPTDFFGPFVQDVVEEALRGQLRDLPGLDYLNTEFIQPLKRGESTIADVRPELVRRSPVLYAGRLPPLQVHHGTADEVVPVGEAERLIEVMEGLGRGEPEFEYYIYNGGTHNPLTLSGSLERTRTFVSRLLSAAQVAE
jgi:dipeptidyl aminopeptidase/acylaminoacyl peptidase